MVSYYNYFFLLICEFIAQALPDGFHRSLSNSKFPQVSRTLLSILADLNTAVIWMIPTCAHISKFSSPSTSPWRLYLVH